MSFCGTRPCTHDEWAAQQAAHDLLIVAAEYCADATGSTSPAHVLIPISPNGAVSDHDYLSALLASEHVLENGGTANEKLAALAVLMRAHLMGHMPWSVSDEAWFDIASLADQSPFSRRAVYSRSLRLMAKLQFSSCADDWIRRYHHDAPLSPQKPPEGVLGCIAASIRNHARLLSASSIRSISQADNGWCASEHEEALTRLVEEADFILTQEMNWFPSEVIELTANVPQQPDFYICSGILMLNDLLDGRMGYMNFRWFSAYEAYLGNDATLGQTLLRGFRLLLEQDENWDIETDWGYAVRSEGSIRPFIPYFDDWRGLD